jgi:glycosyltransferase involved in cell wall biosynthesis
MMQNTFQEKGVLFINRLIYILKTMKLLRIIPSMNPKHGGPSQGIRNSIPALQKLGVENEVVCLDDPSESFVVQSPFVIHALGDSKSSWSFNKTLESWLKERMQDYDAVIVHGLWSYHSYVTLKVYNELKRSKEVPKIYIMPHGMLDPWFQRDKSRRLKAVRNEIYWRLIEKKVVNSADGILFTCEQELLLARETFKGYKPKAELNIGYGIQAPPEYSDTMPPVIAEKPYWLFLSRIHPKKGVDILIKAYQELSKLYSDLPDLVIAGPTDSDYSQEMITLAAGDSKIHFVGLLQGESKWGAFYGAELFVLPSHQENFGIAVVEALACGVPVLISDQVNIWREIDFAGGGLVEKDTLDGVRTLLSKWLKLNLRERNILSTNAKKTFRSHFRVETLSETLSYLLKES